MTDRVRVALSDGSTGTVPAESLTDVIAQGGRVTTPEENAAAKKAAAGFSTGAAALGALTGVSGGIVPTVASGLAGLASPEAGSSVRGAWREAQADSPGSFAAGEVAGQVGGLFLGGGALGNAVEGVAARGLSGLAARGVAGRALASGGALAARGAVETGVYGAAREMSDETIAGDPELNAEKIWSAFGANALTGAAVGGIFGAGSSLIGSGVRAARGAVAERVAERSAGKAAAAEEALAKTSAAVEDAGEAAATAGAAPKPTFLQKQAGEQAWLALAPDKRVSGVVSKSVDGGHAAVGRTLIEEGILGRTAADAARTTPEVATARAKDALGKWGRRIGEIRDGVDVTAPASSVAEHVRGVAASTKGGAMADVRRNLNKLADDIDASLGVVRETDEFGKSIIVEDPAVGLAEMARERIALQARAGFEKLNPTIGQEALQKARAAMASAEFSLIDEAANAVGDVTRMEALKAANQKYRHLSFALDALEGSEARRAGNNFFSLRDTGAALAAGASGNPLLAVPMAIGSKLARERGNAVAALTLHRLSGGAAIAKAAAKVDAQIAKAAKVAAGTEAAAPRSLPDSRMAYRYPAAIKEAATLQQNAAKLVDHVASTPLSDTHPRTATALTVAAMRAANYLATQMPQTPERGGLGGPDKPPRADAATMARFVRTLEVVKDPTVALSRVSSGTVRREDVDALKAVAPKMYEELRVKVVEEVTARKAAGKPLSERERIRIGILLDAQTDPALAPERLRALQQSLQSTPSAMPQGGSRPVASRPVNLHAEPSGIDRIEAR